MVDFNIANFITIGLISVSSYALIKFIFEKMGYNPSWL